ncbi:MAG TPA: hypothetical protein VGX23_30465 [Actinocrinis sp.]|nr:hypothetical protein [Actinocrinis sp.]
MNSRSVALTGIAAGAVLVGVGYPLLWRTPCLTWGASDEEARRAMPGDHFLPDAPLVSTRAVTIDAHPSAIWPWLVQMGPGRGGAYTYDWIENLFALNMHSATSILPEFQDLKIADVIALGAKGPKMRVEVLEPDQTLVLHAQDGTWVWAFGLYPRDGATRLVSRNRIATPHPSPASTLVSCYIMEPGSLVMERKMLLGIKERAEQPTHSAHSTV